MQRESNATERHNELESRVLGKIHSPNILKIFSNLLLIIFTVIFISLFLPWRQTVTGLGQVTVFSPMERPQTIHSQINAKLIKLHVKEGDKVKAGDLIIELGDLDPKFMDAMQVERLEGQRTALIAKRSATERLISSFNEQIDSLGDLRNAAIPSADLKIKQDIDRVRSAEQKLKSAEQIYETAKLNFDRRKQLFEKGLSSKRDLELAELSYVETRAGLESVKAELDIAERSISMSKLDLSKVSAEAAFKIQEADSKLASSYEKLAEINSDIFKMEIEISNFASRVEQRKIFAPVDGQVVRIFKVGQAETLKPGDEIATIVPETFDQAVELYVSDVFVPLISVGRSVRIQFSGYPALQFSGWPNAAFGTFPGLVTVIDAVDDEGSGSYRILVKPDYERIHSGKDQSWPDISKLRPGTKATGWIILDEVPLWYELWRIFNGFPPSIMHNESKSNKKIIKPSK